MDERVRGVIAPCITPFRADGEVNVEAFIPYLDFLADRVHALAVCAIYGSGIMMPLAQRQQTAEIAVQAVRGRIPVMVFAGAPDTDTSVSLAIHAQQIGASAVTCVAPFYYRQVDEALYRHFKALLGAVHLPVYAYDSPAYSGNQLSLPLLERLADAGLAGVITGAAGYGLEHLWACLRRLGGEHFDVLSMRDGLALPAMMMGSPAFDSGVANFFPELVVGLYQATQEGQYATAARLQDQVLRLRDISHLLGRNIPTLHALIQMRGLPGGVPKRPFFPLSPEEVDQLGQHLQALDFDTPLVV